MMRMHTRWVVGAAMLVGIGMAGGASAAWAQNSAPPTPPADSKPAEAKPADAKPVETKPVESKAAEPATPGTKTGEQPGDGNRGGALPDLDSLLGLPKEGQGAEGKEAPAAAVDPARKELERKLSPQKMQDEFAEAAGLMDQTAGRLVEARDAGLATQRLQEDILKRLDKLIAAAEQQSGGKSKPKPQPAQQDQDQAQNQQQKNQARRAATPQRATKSSEQAEAPARQDGALGQAPTAAPAAWGELPAHVRQALLQGFSDRFSSIYQSMTEEYYKRLAEEPRR